MTRGRDLAVAVCFLGLSVAAAQAQAPVSGTGIEVGGGLSRLSPPAAGQSNSMKPGLIAGVYAFGLVTKTVGVQIEGLYAQKRSQVTTGSQTADVALDYVEIPVLAKLALFRGIYVLEGIGFGIPVKGRITPSGGSEQDIKDQVTSPDIGIIIGVVFPAGRIGIEGRYDGGLKRVISTAGAPIQRNRSFSAILRIPI